MKLSPFQDAPTHFAVTAETRVTEELEIEFRLTGPLGKLVIDPKSLFPERTKGLWEKTCFEIFFSLPGEKNYWELNLSPAGHWDLFRFESYRKGMQREERIARLEVQTTKLTHTLGLKTTLPVAELGLKNNKLEISATAVLQSRSLNYSYWAWKHAGDQPDFHLRESLIFQA